MSIIPWKFDMVPVHRRSGGGSPLGILQEEINQLFDDLFGEPSAGNRTPSYFPAEKIWNPALDVIEQEKGYKLRAEFPGMEASDLQVECAEGYLTLKGEKKAHTEEKGDHYMRRETSFGSFRRTVQLPEIADMDKAQASFKNGVLTLEIPKKAEVTKTAKTIKIQSAA